MIVSWVFFEGADFQVENLRLHILRVGGTLALLVEDVLLHFGMIVDFHRLSHVRMIQEQVSQEKPWRWVSSCSFRADLSDHFRKSLESALMMQRSRSTAKRHL